MPPMSTRLTIIATQQSLYPAHTSSYNFKPLTAQTTAALSPFSVFFKVINFLKLSSYQLLKVIKLSIDRHPPPPNKEPIEKSTPYPSNRSSVYSAPIGINMMLKSDKKRAKE